MSTSKQTTVWCDVCRDQRGDYEYGARDHLLTDTGSTAAALQEARREGWVRRAGVDLCPYHARHN